MNTQRIALDVSKRAECQPTLTLRQGDRNGTTLEVAITDNGEAMALAGYTVRLCMRLPDNEHYYSVDGTASGSIASFPIDETYAAAYPGRTDEAYIEVLYGEQIICSTHRFAVEIEPGAREGVEPGEMHLAEIDAVIAEVEALIDEIQEGAVFGVKGNAEETYRTGSVNLTPANLGAAEAAHAHAIADVTGLQDALDAKLDDLDVSVTQTATGADITVNGDTVSIANGTDGADGADGYSPTASVERIQSGATITIEDADGVTSATVYDGTNGRDGADGRNGTDGADGADGADGITPTVDVTPITGGHNVAFDYGTGDPRNRDFNVMDGDEPYTWGTVGEMTWAQASAYTWGRLRGQTRLLPPTGGTMKGDLMLSGEVRDLEGNGKYTKTRVKGNAETGYRTGDVNLTPANIGAATDNHTHAASEITNLGTRANSWNTSAISIPNNSVKNLRSHTFEAGTWIFIGHARFVSNATGQRAVCMSTASGTSMTDTELAWGAASVPGMGNNASSVMTVACLSVFTTNTTVYFNGWQNSGSALNCYALFDWMRIK